VPANIAEGQGRQSDADFSRHLYIARGSLLELSTHAEVAGRLTFLADQPAFQLRIDEVGRLLNGLIRSIRP
jgi:four helix bundle protein